MSCGSCGQKYRGLGRTRNVNARRFIRQGKKVIQVPNPTLDVPQPPVTVQPDTKEAVLGTPDSYPIDPSSGLPLSVLQTGNCPENMLGDTAPQPVVLEIADIPGNKNEVG